VNTKLETDKYYMAVPYGRKFFAWFSFDKTDNVCVFMNSKTGEMFIERVPYSNLSLGTVLYGTLVEYKTQRYFSAENVFTFEGRTVANITLLEKMKILFKIMSQNRKHLPTKIPIRISTMWKGTTPPDFYKQSGTYEMVELCDLVVKVKVTAATPPQRPVVTAALQPLQPVVPSRPSLPLHPSPPPTPRPKSKPDTGAAAKCEFYVKADILNDIYHLFTIIDNKLVYQSIAFIPNYKTSVYMNNFFRKIRENKNLDLQEESDDEEDFEDIRYDKYVDLTKIVRLNCVYNYKFKKWAPIIES
jgi:hypothetical protein